MPAPPPLRFLAVAGLVASLAVPASAQEAASPAPGGPLGYARMTDAGWTSFAHYLAAAPPKAFAIGPDGAFGWRRAASLADAMRAAVAECDRYARAGCQVVGANRELLVGVGADGLPSAITLRPAVDAAGLAGLRAALAAKDAAPVSVAATQPRR